MSPGIPSGLTITEMASSLAPFWADPSEEQLRTIKQYIDLLMLWNHKVSLTSIDSPLEIVARHFGESIFAGQILPLQHGRLADVGTGGGFPGLPLKIVFPELEVTLVEPNLKKCAFLTEVVDLLGLRRVKIVRSQFTEIMPADTNFDYIASRALGSYKSLLRWTRGALRPQGSVVLWLGQEDSILVGRNSEWAWQAPTRIPESQRRLILVGNPKAR
jgi:16S rRNA (guanine527-N7)-methyltransferase